MRNKVVGFTGHRPHRLGSYNPKHPQRIGIRKALESEIRKSIEEGYDTFISGLALGVDTDAAEIVLYLREEEGYDIKLIGAAPCDAQEYLWPLSDKVKYQYIVRECDSFVIVNPGEYAPWKMFKRDEWIVDESSKLIAVWDGSWKGGTAHTVRYARKAEHKPIIHRINPEDYKWEVDLNVPR